MKAQSVILGPAMKTLSNCTNHIAGTPLDEAFAEAAWSPPHATHLGLIQSS